MNNSEVPVARLCFVYDLGTIGHEDSVQIQQRLVNIVSQGLFDVLLLLQHPPCLTTGRFRGGKDIVASSDTLAREGISIFHTDRGGGVTYHGPGQLIGYPILNLRENKLTIPQYIWKLEEVILKTLLDLDIYGRRMPKHPGVWVGGAKICSIGLRIIQDVAMHGFALNVNPKLHNFEFIHPCGIAGQKMTSISKLIGYEVEVKDVKENLLQAFSQVFSLKIKAGSGIEMLDRYGALNSQNPARAFTTL